MSAPVLGTSPSVGDGLQVKGPPPRVPLRLACPPKAVGKHSPTPPREKPPPAKKARDEPIAEKEELVPMGDAVDWSPDDDTKQEQDQARKEDASMDEPELASGSSEHARSGPTARPKSPPAAAPALSTPALSALALRPKAAPEARPEAAPEARPAADPEATPAAGASWQHQDADEVIDVTDRRGWAVRHDTTGMVPYESTLFRDPVTLRPQPRRARPQRPPAT